MDVMRRLLNRVFLFLLILFSYLSASAETYSTSPRVTGVEILQEIVQQGKQGFTVRVGSNGCTAKNSFTVSVEKVKGAIESAPHYLLTLIRTVPDECKAIVDDGELITYDLQKDFGITGNSAYSITNPVTM
jgi:hypothetical protein